MLVREQPATELTIATRILARAGVLAANGRLTLRLEDVVYIGGRGIGLVTMTPYDVAVVLLRDGVTLHGSPPNDLAAYLDAHRRVSGAASVARVADGEFVSASTLRACVVAALRRARGEEATHDEVAIEHAWLDLVSGARMSGALIGAFPTEEEPGS
jgi:ribulose-5-phosphate 4-epimerase/fuculose-1-phosphate aldolase